jgi:hypothetical protein
MRLDNGLSSCHEHSKMLDFINLCLNIYYSSEVIKVSFLELHVYVDGVILARNDLHDIKETKNFLSKKFKLKNLGQLKYFLGIEVARSQHGISLSHQKYA